MESTVWKKIMRVPNESEQKEMLAAIRSESDDQLEDDLARMLDTEQQCRTLAGIGPEQPYPFWICGLVGWMAGEIHKELECREHSYVEQGEHHASQTH